MQSQLYELELGDPQNYTSTSKPLATLPLLFSHMTFFIYKDRASLQVTFLSHIKCKIPCSVCHSFLDEDDQPLVKPPKIMDNINGSSNGTSTACPNPCAKNSSSSSSNTTCSILLPSSTGAGQMCGWGCPIPIPACNGRVI